MKKCGLLGEKLGHSFSPLLHAYLADYAYALYEKKPDELAEFLRQGEFDGLNVTIPYKKSVVPYCAELSDVARKLGNVNTIVKRRDGTLYGDNSDYFGFRYMLRKADISPRGEKVLVLGSGGASLTASAVMRDLGASEVVVISRGGEDNYSNLEKHRDARVLVNATPVGMYPEIGISPVDLSRLDRLNAVLDLIYNPYRTELLLQAEDRGIRCLSGLVMLAAQAKRSAEVFLDAEIPDERIDFLYEQILRLTRNIALIGMPGCGKSAVGRELARETGREFFDTDDMVAVRAGKSAEQILEDDGEETLRRLESAALCEVAAKSGCVIATGGGVIKRPENRRALRRNSVTVFVDRDVGELPVGGRPLSQKTGIERLAAQRIPLYKEWSDCAVTVRGGVAETAMDIKEMLLL